MITIYSKENCSYCVNALNLLNSSGVKYKQIKLNTPNEISAFKDSYPNVRTLPYILDDERVVGGYSELLSYINGGGIDSK